MPLANAQSANSTSGQAASLDSAPASAQQAIPVTVALVEKQTVEDVETFLGTLLARQDIWVTSATPGMVTQISFKPGQEVATGTLLYQLDDRQVRADAKEVEADFTNAQLQYKRISQLKKRKLASDEQLDTARSASQAANARLEAANLRIDLYKVHAPFAGVIGLSKVHVGAYVNPGAEMVRLEDVSELLIDFSVPQNLLPRLALGMNFRLTITALPDQHLQGQVSFIDPEVRQDSRSIDVRGKISDPPATLVPGLSASVGLVLDSREDALVVPSTALNLTLQGARVFQVDDGIAREVDVELGVRSGNKVEIRAGLVAGASVVVVGQEQLRDGASVTVVPASGN